MAIHGDKLGAYWLSHIMVETGVVQISCNDSSELYKAFSLFKKNIYIDWVDACVDRYELVGPYIDRWEI